MSTKGVRSDDHIDARAQYALQRVTCQSEAHDHGEQQKAHGLLRPSKAWSGVLGTRFHCVWRFQTSAPPNWRRLRAR